MEIKKQDILKELNSVYLYPFYGFCLFYFLVFQPCWDYPPMAFSTVLSKVLPIWSLAGFVRYSSNEGRTQFIPESNYHKFIMLGLIFSSLGDAFLVSRHTLFIPGMLMFTVAHVFYLLGFGPGDDNSRLKSLFSLAFFAVFLFIGDGIDSAIMYVLVLIYTVLIFAVGWRAVSRYEQEDTYPSLFGSVGMLLFLLSDFVIAIDKWKFPVPFSAGIVMVTYYAGQLGVALSAKILEANK